MKQVALFALPRSYRGKEEDNDSNEAAGIRKLDALLRIRRLELCQGSSRVLHTLIFQRRLLSRTSHLVIGTIKTNLLPFARLTSY